MTLDDEVNLINKCGRRIFNLHCEDEDISDACNNLILWTGGLHKDLLLYSTQLLLCFHKLSWDWDDKCEARIKTVDDFLEYNGDGYIADLYQDVDKQKWPIVHLDGTTFEDRLEELAEEVAPEKVYSDMLLTGTIDTVTLDFDQKMKLVVDCCYSLNETYIKYGEKSILLNERMNRFIGWLMEIEPEFAVCGMKVILAIHRIKFDYSQTPNWGPFIEKHHGILTTI